MPRTFALRSFASAIALLGAVACGGGGGDTPSTPTPPAPTVQSVAVTPASATLTAVGQSTTLAADVRLSNGTAGTQAVTWSSSNAAVATVSGGVVTAVASGVTTISASVGAIAGQATITVAIPTVQTVAITPSSATLTAAGQTAALTAQVLLSNGAAGTQTPTWTSTNTAVATVSASGVVTAVANGQSTIVATVGTVTGQAAVTVAIPFVQTVTVAPTPVSLVSLGATAVLTAQVRLSNGALANQTPTWTSSNTAVATVNAGTVTAVGNGTATITAAVGSVTGTSTVTVAQAVASVRLLPTDTVVKTSSLLRGAALDARGNVIAGATLTYTSLTPNVTSVNPSGSLTPLATGVARVRVSMGAFSDTSIVRTIHNVVRLTDLVPLYEFSASAGQRRAFSDVSQGHADARAALMGSVWSYFESIFPSSGSANTEMFFTTWPEIWLEASPFCGGVLFPNQDVYQTCNTPNWTHWIIPGTSPNDQVLIIRWLARQFLVSSMTTVSAFPWFVAGYSLWMSGGSFQGNVIVGNPRGVVISDFRTGDTQNLLVPLDSLVRLNNARFNENVPLRTPVAVRQAQSTLFVSYLNREYPTLLPAILARIRATPGATFTNELLLEEIVNRTGRTFAQMEAPYLAYARSLQP